MSDSANEERERRLLEWCKQKTGKYNISVSDFDKSWKDGLVCISYFFFLLKEHFFKLKLSRTFFFFFLIITMSV